MRHRRNMKFYHAAKKASKFERVMNYTSAAECWKEAALLCCHRDNIEWCVNRAMFCEAFPQSQNSLNSGALLAIEQL